MTDTTTPDDAAAKPKAAKGTPTKKTSAKKAAPKTTATTKAKAAPKKAKAVPGTAGISDTWKKVLAALAKAGSDGMNTAELTKACEKHEAAPYWNRFLKQGVMESPARGVYRLTAAGKKAIAD
jgi:hypothetical protein